MPEHELFGRALGLEAPWAVMEVRFDGEARRLDLSVDFPEGSRSPCPVCGRAGCPIHDTSGGPGATGTSSSTRPP